MIPTFRQHPIFLGIINSMCCMEYFISDPQCSPNLSEQSKFQFSVFIPILSCCTMYCTPCVGIPRGRCSPTVSRVESSCLKKRAGCRKHPRTPTEIVHKYQTLTSRSARSFLCSCCSSARAADRSSTAAATSACFACRASWAFSTACHRSQNRGHRERQRG